MRNLYDSKTVGRDGSRVDVFVHDLPKVDRSVWVSAVAPEPNERGEFFRVEVPLEPRDAWALGQHLIAAAALAPIR